MWQEVSNGRTSTAVVYGRLQTASGRSGGFERPLDRLGCQGTWPARFRFAPLGGAAWGRARAAALGGPRGGDRPVAARSRSFSRMERDILKKSIAIFAGTRT